MDKESVCACDVLGTAHVHYPITSCSPAAHRATTVNQPIDTNEYRQPCSNFEEEEMELLWAGNSKSDVLIKETPRHMCSYTHTQLNLSENMDSSEGLYTYADRGGYD